VTGGEAREIAQALGWQMSSWDDGRRWAITAGRTYIHRDPGRCLLLAIDGEHGRRWGRWVA
jgi:hypothetical protein